MDHKSESSPRSYYDTSTVEDALNIGAIVGGILGGITLLSIIIAVVCVIYKKHSRPNHVIQPIGGATVANVTSHTQGYNMTPQQYPTGYPVQGYGGGFPAQGYSGNTAPSMPNNPDNIGHPNMAGQNATS